jgi:hypothetical protein
MNSATQHTFLLSADSGLRGGLRWSETRGAQMLNAHGRDLTSKSAFVTITHTLDPAWGESTAAYR